MQDGPGTPGLVIPFMESASMLRTCSVPDTSRHWGHSSEQDRKTPALVGPAFWLGRQAKNMLSKPCEERPDVKKKGRQGRGG